METSTRGRRTFVDIPGAAHAGVSRRTLLKLFAAGTGSLVLAGCGGASAPASPTASSPPTSAPSGSNAAVPTTSAVPTPSRSAQPKSGGTLRAAIVGDLPSIDGQQNLPGINSTVGNAYERLVLYGDNLTPQPVLTEGWDLSTD